MSNLTIIRGRPGSGKTTRLRKIERDAKAKGQTVYWFTGHAATEAGIDAVVQEGNVDVVLFDECDRTTLDWVRRVAARHVDVQFAIAS